MFRRITFMLLAFAFFAAIPTIRLAIAATITGAELTPINLVDKIFSECGLIAGVFGFLAFYFAKSTANARTEWTADRSGMMTIIRAQDENFTKLSIAYAKLEGMLIAAQQRH